MLDLAKKIICTYKIFAAYVIKTFNERESGKRDYYGKYGLN